MSGITGVPLEDAIEAFKKEHGFSDTAWGMYEAALSDIREGEADLASARERAARLAEALREYVDPLMAQIEAERAENNGYFWERRLLADGLVRGHDVLEHAALLAELAADRPPQPEAGATDDPIPHMPPLTSHAVEIEIVEVRQGKPGEYHATD